MFCLKIRTLSGAMRYYNLWICIDRLFAYCKGGNFNIHTVQIANEFTIFAGLVRDSCESNACEINAYSFANTRTFREVLHMNQSETRGPRTG